MVIYKNKSITRGPNPVDQGETKAEVRSVLHSIWDDYADGLARRYGVVYGACITLCHVNKPKPIKAE